MNNDSIIKPVGDLTKLIEALPFEDFVKLMVGLSKTNVAVAKMDGELQPACYRNKSIGD